MKALHAGYVSGAVWKAIHAGQMSPDLDWLDVISRLSHFVIDQDVGGAGVLPPELSVLENLLCRGLPTLPSLYVERFLAEKTGLVTFAEAGNKDVAAFRCEFTDESLPHVLPYLARAFCAVSPTAELEPSEGFIFPAFGSGEENTEFDSTAEREFWNGPLTILLGKGGMQLALRQRPLESIAGERFAGRRVDCAVQLPGSNGMTLPKGIVFEVDGPTHSPANAQVGDARRDEACLKEGLATTYRHKLWNRVRASDPINRTHLGIAQLLQHPYLRLANQNIAEPLATDAIGTAARSLALFPMAVARIQRVLLELVRGGTISMNAPTWHVLILDRDGLPGCGAVAAEDLRTWLIHLYALYRPECGVPEICVHERADTGSDLALPEHVDVLLDVSVEMRYGVSRPTPPEIRGLAGLVPRVVIRSDYYNRHPYHRLSFSDPVALKIQDPDLERELTFFLQNVFRKVAFRAKQVEIITRALKNESVIALLPTGAGKSITYQLPSLLQNGLAVVIDPIKSLMKDQDDNLKAAGISATAFINSMSTAKERRLNTKLLQEGCFKFVFVSPERFIIREFRDALAQMRSEGRVYFAYAVIDEAHCVSEWGHDFRTAYLRLGANARKYCPVRVDKLPMLALTGTASFEVLDDVHLELGHDRGENISVRPDKMERENLKYRVVKLANPPPIPSAASEKYVSDLVGAAKLNQMPKIVSASIQELNSSSLEDFLNGEHGSGLVFCPHAGVKGGIHGVVRVRQALAGACQKCDSRIGVYYGGGADDRAAGAGFDPIKTQDDFKQNTLRVLACTKAFGMGIDKPDIRFTLHHNIPSSLESFYQEAGRAGRDGEIAQCWLFYSGVTIPATGNTLDFQLNYRFHTNAFPGAAIEEAKVFELLDENRVPGPSVCNDLASMLADETGVAFRVGTWSNGGGLCRLYINHPDYPDAKVYFRLPEHGDVAPGYNAPYPDHQRIISLTTAWLTAHRLPALSWWNWLNHEEGIRTEPGIEAVLADCVDHATTQICLSCDNGYLKAIASGLHLNVADVERAYSFSDDTEAFIAKLSKDKPLLPQFQERLRIVFTKIRLREHTFRAVYRLSVLGVVEDFEADYNTMTLTVTLNRLPEGACLAKLRAYIRRHAPMDESRYMQAAETCEYPTELRRCLHALILFVYERIAKQRKEALKIMEQTCVRGIDDANAFRDAVTYFFDSGFLPRLRPHLNDYTPELVFEIIAETAGSSAQVSHLLGACLRLLPENPDNAAFRALHAYAQALLGYKDQDVKEELTAALAGFEKYMGWGRQEKLSFLMQMRELIATVIVDRARVFDATIIDDHVLWMKTFRQQSTESSAGEVPAA
jgi:superfamily II DNA helicase RecQ